MEFLRAPAIVRDHLYATGGRRSGGTVHCIRAKLIHPICALARSDIKENMMGVWRSMSMVRGAPLLQGTLTDQGPLRDTRMRANYEVISYQWQIAIANIAPFLQIAGEYQNIS